METKRQGEERVRERESWGGGREECACVGENITGKHEFFICTEVNKNLLVQHK